MQEETLRIEIAIGNAAMSDPADIAAALRTTADRVETGQRGLACGIKDANGNTVGSLWVETAD